MALTPSDKISALNVINAILGQITYFKHRLKDREIFDAESTLLAQAIIDNVALIDTVQ